MVSAHWVTSRCHVLDVAWPKTIHDFYGFPRPLYEVHYPAPGAVTEAKRLAMEHHLQTDQEWGLEHGAWSVLRHLYPDADVPVFEVSLDHACGFPEHVALGKRMRHLRERGVLILGSGNLVHNLRKINWEMPHASYPWAEECDHKVKKAIAEHDVESLSAPDRWGLPKRTRPSSTMRRFSTASVARTSATGSAIHARDGVRRDLDAHGALRAREYLKGGGTARNVGASQCQVATRKRGE